MEGFSTDKQTRRTFHYVSAFWLLLITFLALTTYAAPPTSKYTPGETLDPSCAPGASNCSVDPGIAPFFTATSTNATSTFAGSLTIDTSGFVYSTTTGNVGIGTTSPYAKLSVVGEIVGAYFTGTTTATSTFAGGINVFAINQTGSATSTFANGVDVTGGCVSVNGTCLGSASVAGSDSHIQYNNGGTLGGSASFVFDDTNNRIGIGTTTPYAMLSVAGEIVGSHFTATSTTATSTFSGGLSINGGAFEHRFSTGVTAIDNLEIGALNFDTNAGIVTWVDMPVTSNASISTVQSYRAQIDGESLLTLYAESDGTGGLIATSTRVGIGTTTPYAELSVVGEVAAEFFTATSTSATSTFQGGLAIGTSTNELGIYVLDSQIVNFENGGDNIATLSAAGAWTDAPSFSYLKQDRELLSLSKTLEILSTTTIESYKVIDEVDLYGQAAADIHIGIILDEAHDMLSTHNQNGDIIGFSPMRTASVAFRGVQLFINLIDISNATISSSTPAMAIAANNFIGIGTTTPDYTLHVEGEIAAQSFVNISTKEAKNTIVYLNEDTLGSFSSKLKDINLATYHYNQDDEDEPLRLGLIAEEAPEEILSAGGKGIDLYKMATFSLGVLKDQQVRIDDLEARVKSLENRINAGEGVSGLMNDISEGVSSFASIVTDRLTVGRSSQPAGITLYDEVTNQPYCLTISNGEINTDSGECSDPTAESAPPTITLTGPNPLLLPLGAPFIDPGFYATDDSGMNPQTSSEGDDFDTSVNGTHTVTYTATDNHQNTTTLTRTVIVGAGSEGSSGDPDSSADEEGSGEGGEPEESAEAPDDSQESPAGSEEEIATSTPPIIEEEPIVEEEATTSTPPVIEEPPVEEEVEEVVVEEVVEEPAVEEPVEEEIATSTPEV